MTSPISGRIGKSSVTEGHWCKRSGHSDGNRAQRSIYVDVTQSSNDFLRLKQELANGTLKQENGKSQSGAGH